MGSVFNYSNMFEVITKNQELMRRKQMIDGILKNPGIKKLLQKASKGEFDLDDDNKNFSEKLVKNKYEINAIIDDYMQEMYGEGQNEAIGLAERFDERQEERTEGLERAKEVVKKEEATQEKIQTYLEMFESDTSSMSPSDPLAVSALNLETSGRSAADKPEQEPAVEDPDPEADADADPEQEQEQEEAVKAVEAVEAVEDPEQEPAGQPLGPENKPGSYAPGIKLGGKGY